ncbi:MAG: twin-arginine translocation pathway signal [Beijerinckiaceae bacterium]
MTQHHATRREIIRAGATMAGVTFVTGASGLLLPAHAQGQPSGKGLAPTPTMRGGANNYLPGAPVVSRIGGGGFVMSGTVRRAGDGAPLPGIRIQIWAHTTEGYESDQRSHGATLTGPDGTYRLDMPQIVPAFGQAHGHLAYDGKDFKTVFLRPVMASAKDKGLSAHFVLQPV